MVGSSALGYDIQHSTVLQQHQFNHLVKVFIKSKQQAYMLNVQNITKEKSANFKISN